MSNNNFPFANQLTVLEALSWGYVQLSKGQAQQTKQFCLSVLQVMSYQPDAQSLLGIMAYAYEKLDLAITSLREICLQLIVPGAVAENALIAHAALFVEMGQKADAMAVFDRALEIFSGSLHVKAARLDSKLLDIVTLEDAT